MLIKSVYIKNFRSIKEQTIALKNFTMLIGDNGTGKTAILEAINYAMSPYYLSNRVKHTDFYRGKDEPILIELETQFPFVVHLPDGYATQSIECSKIRLEIKKRDKAAPNKAFSDSVVIEHIAVPDIEKNDPKGWKIERKSGRDYKFDTRVLALSNIDFGRSFYFDKNRDNQIKHGYNSSISTVFEDFNWRYRKALRSEDYEAVQSDALMKSSLEQHVQSKVPEQALKKTIQTLNDKLITFGIEKLDISLFDLNAPFDRAFLGNNVGSLDLPVSKLGSGIEMIVSLLFLETIANLSKERLVIIIDEPEMHLHPNLQEKLVKYLTNISDTVQVIVSTHSPYFFKNYCSNTNIKLLVTKSTDDGAEITNAADVLNLFPWSPSWGEINYVAYGLPTVEFHNELYGYLQEVTGAYTILEIEKSFNTKGCFQHRSWIKMMNREPKEEQVTLMTYIRNSIHHPENTSNEQYTYEELRESINIMVDLIQDSGFNY